MRFTTYSKYKGKWLDALNIESLLENLSDFLMDGGFAGGPNYHPYWGWSGDEDKSSTDALKNALLKALVEGGQLTPEMIDELRGEGQGDEAIQKQVAELLDDLVQRMVEEGYINLETGSPQIPGSTYDVTGQGNIDEAKQAAQQVQFNLTGKGMDFLGYRALKSLLSAIGKASAGSHDTPHLSTGIEAEAASKPYEFGDSMNLDIPATLKNAIEREGLNVPLNLNYGDLMVHQAEYRSSCATVLMLDISHSMVLYGEDRFAPAKRVALAMSHMIRTPIPGRFAPSGHFRGHGTGDSAVSTRDGSGWPVPHEHCGRTQDRAADLGLTKEGHETDHHDHRREAERHDAPGRAGLHQLGWPGPQHPGTDVSGSGSVPEIRHPDQHFHAGK